jgi:hypothetical protein
MLEYVKTVLYKVSFNESLFKKELAKSLDWLNNQEKLDLQEWIGANFGNQYSEVMEIFENVAA